MELFWLKFYLILWAVSSGDSRREGQFQSIHSIDGEEETLVLSSLRLVGKQRLLNGTITFLADLDDTNVGEIVIYSFKNGEWIQSNIKVHTTACDMLANYVRKFLIQSAETDLPSGGKDCIKKRTYYLKDVQPSWEQWPTFLASGLAKFNIQIISSEGKGVGGVEAVFHLSS